MTDLFSKFDPLIEQRRALSPAAWKTRSTW
jgi:hypothetical protein